MNLKLRTSELRLSIMLRSEEIEKWRFLIDLVRLYMVKQWSSRNAETDLSLSRFQATFSVPITFVDSEARTGDTGEAPRSRDALISGHGEAKVESRYHLSLRPRWFIFQG
jgi:hypothetical protein